MIHLRSVGLVRPDEEAATAGYPFNVPAIAALARTPLAFDTPVTFLVGENGTGKSAMLEGIACAANAIAIAGVDLQRDAQVLNQRASSPGPCNWSGVHGAAAGTSCARKTSSGSPGISRNFGARSKMSWRRSTLRRVQNRWVAAWLAVHTSVRLENSGAQTPS